VRPRFSSGVEIRFKNAAKSRPGAKAEQPAAPSPIEIAKRAHELQDAASERSEKLSNEQARRAAYREAGIAV
jgi:hypothetical protein